MRPVYETPRNEVKAKVDFLRKPILHFALCSFTAGRCNLPLVRLDPERKWNESAKVGEREGKASGNDSRQATGVEGRTEGAKVKENVSGRKSRLRGIGRAGRKVDAGARVMQRRRRR